MYLRHVKVRKNGKTHTYWRLVRSVRRGAKVYQELVAYLGELDAEGRLRARDLAKRITGREDPGQLDLFESPPDETVQVRVGDVRLERSRVFGDAWLVWILWKSLRFDRLLSRLLPPGREDVAWPQIIATLVIARVCDPSSELHIAEQWFRKTALDDLLGIPEDKINDDRLYRALDRLLPLKEDLEQHVRNRMGELFEIDYEILLYDITSTYFEGEAKANPLARRGHSRDQRPDCKQVNIALVATKEGLPLAYEVFPGNTTDVTTVKEIVSTIEARFGRASRIWIMDRGMVSDTVLEWLREESRSYIVGTPRSLLKKFETQLLQERDWQTVRDGLEVKPCPSPDGTETFILCRSEARREKERATHERFAARIEQGLRGLERRLAQAKKKEDPAETGKQIGRLLERNRRAAKLFEIQVHSDSENRCGIGITWKRDEKHGAWARLSEGCYLLRAYGVDWTPEKLWRAYIQLTDVEEAFRIHKTELKLRPVWHKTEERTLGHILVCFLAYVLWKTLEQWMQRAGLGKSPRKLLEELCQIQSTDVILPTTDGRELRLRCVPRPEKPLAILLDRLGLALPQRLHPPKCLAEM